MTNEEIRKRLEFDITVDAIKYSTSALNTSFDILFGGSRIKENKIKEIKEKFIRIEERIDACGEKYYNEMLTTKVYSFYDNINNLKKFVAVYNKVFNTKLEEITLKSSMYKSLNDFKETKSNKGMFYMDLIPECNIVRVSAYTCVSHCRPYEINKVPDYIKEYKLEWLMKK